MDYPNPVDQFKRLDALWQSLGDDHCDFRLGSSLVITQL
jgi:hypothetical protein